MFCHTEPKDLQSFDTLSCCLLILSKYRLSVYSNINIAINEIRNETASAADPLTGY